MTPSPHASLAVAPPTVRGAWRAALTRGVIAPLLRGLRLLDPVWPGLAAPGREPDSRLLDHLAG